MPRRLLLPHPHRLLSRRCPRRHCRTSLPRRSPRPLRSPRRRTRRMEPSPCCWKRRYRCRWCCLWRCRCRPQRYYWNCRYCRLLRCYHYRRRLGSRLTRTTWLRHLRRRGLAIRRWAAAHGRARRFVGVGRGGVLVGVLDRVRDGTGGRRGRRGLVAVDRTHNDDGGYDNDQGDYAETPIDAAFRRCGSLLALIVTSRRVRIRIWVLAGTAGIWVVLGSAHSLLKSLNYGGVFPLLERRVYTPAAFPTKPAWKRERCRCGEKLNVTPDFVWLFRLS